MESNSSKSKNLISKSKLVMSLHRATKPFSAALQPYSSKPPKPSPSIDSSEFVANQPNPAPPSSGKPESAVGFIYMNQDQDFPQQTPKVAFMTMKDRIPDSYGKLDSFYGAWAEDESVDAKAAKYISRVQESFRLERVNSGRKINTEDSHM